MNDIGKMQCIFSWNQGMAFNIQADLQVSGHGSKYTFDAIRFCNVWFEKTHCVITVISLIESELLLSYWINMAARSNPWNYLFQKKSHLVCSGDLSVCSRVPPLKSQSQNSAQKQSTK